MKPTTAVLLLISLPALAAGVNYGETFRVEDGVLKVVYDKAKYDSFGGRFGRLFCKTPFSHYVIAAQRRAVNYRGGSSPTTSRS